jgi:hypothetical protein
VLADPLGLVDHVESTVPRGARVDVDEAQQVLGGPLCG